jgi:1,2-diacylglycerol 3-alpha-glucosyltransferase
MRIGFFTDSYLPIVHGVVVSIETFRKVLEEMGHQVFIYAPEHPSYKDKTPNVFRFKSKRIIKKPEMRYAFNFLPVNCKFKKISHFKLDIVHAHTPFAMGFLAKYISKRQLIPLIYTHHTDYPEYAKYYFKEKLFLPYLARAYSVWFANLSDAIIIPSLKVKEDLLDYGVKKNIPICTLQTGVNLKLFRKSLKNRRALRKKLNISPEKKVLITVSRLGREKNIEFLIKSFAKIKKKKKDILFLIVGDGPDSERLEKMARRMKITDSVIFTGAIPHKEIPAYYQSSDIFIFASLTDIQPIVILEALACGLPTVVLKDKAFTDVVLDNKNGFLIDGHFSNPIKLFSQKIIKILENQVLYKKFSISALKTGRSFSEKKMAENLLEIYKKQIKKQYQ